MLLLILILLLVYFGFIYLSEDFLRLLLDFNRFLNVRGQVLTNVIRVLKLVEYGSQLHNLHVRMLLLLVRIIFTTTCAMVHSWHLKLIV